MRCVSCLEVQALSNSLKDSSATLSPREHQVFWVATGLLNQPLAAELGASKKTIKVHRAGVA
jgi:FixJ family two-component response regulator